MSAMSAKTKKLIVDALTVAMLVVAFGLAFYTGLVGKNDAGEAMLSLNIFSIIAIIGTLVLVAVGGASEMIARIKNNTVTWSFTAFMAVQAVAFVGMCALVIGLASGAFSTDSPWIRGLFLSFVAVEVLGYIQAVIYTNTLESRMPVEEDESFDEDCDLSDEDAEV